MSVVSDDFFEAINEKKNPDSFSSDLLLEATNLKSQGFFKQSNIECLNYSQLSEIKSRAKRHVNMIILQITQRCNMRCTYCSYSYNSGFERTHSNSDMDFETIRQAIDFYAAHSVDSARKSIGFYGGEPLLCFESIKKAVDYAKTVFAGHEIHFSITTNGLLLNDQYITDFLVENDFSITLSLDANRTQHDLNRRLPHSEDSSYDLVSNNLDLFFKRYLDNSISLKTNTVIDQSQTLLPIVDTLMKNRHYPKLQYGLTFIDDLNMENPIAFSDRFLKEYEYLKFLSYLYMEDKVELPERLYPIVEIFMESICDNITGLLHMPSFNETEYPSGTCQIGSTRLFVNANGFLLPCERISEVNSWNQIGHVTYGFSNHKLSKMQNIAVNNQEQCSKCFALRHCHLCPRQFLTNNIKPSELFCDRVKSTLIKKLTARAKWMERMQND